MGEPWLRESRLLRLGRRLLKVFATCLVVGGIAASIFFPQRLGQGLTREMLFVLVPIWAIGTVALLMLVAGWILHPTIAPTLELGFRRRDDGAYFGPFVKRLAIVTFLLLACVSVASFLIEVRRDPVAALAIYWMLVMAIFVIFLAKRFSEFRHPVTTTYINVLSPVFALLLIPATWPALIWLTCAARARLHRPFDLRDELES